MKNDSDDCECEPDCAISDGRIAVEFKKVHPDAKLPFKKNGYDDACWDLFSVEDLWIYPGEIKLIDTGLQMRMPTNLEATIRPRSGLAVKGLSIVNSPGTIDSGYRGNIKIIMINLGTTAMEIEKGDRIAQMQFNIVMDIRFDEVDDLDDSKRGAGGFGSTGTK